MAAEVTSEEIRRVAKLRHLRGALPVCHVTDYRFLSTDLRLKRAGTTWDASRTPRDPPSPTQPHRPCADWCAVMKAATIRDVAERAQVSVASVSRVLTGAGAVTEPTRLKVLEAVEALSYVPHSGARSLSTSRTDTVGVILPDLFGEFFSELIRGMDLAARASGLHLIVSSSHDDALEAAAAIRSMRGRVDGLIVLSPHLDAANLAASLAGRAAGPADERRGQRRRAPIHRRRQRRRRRSRRSSTCLRSGRRRIVHIGGPTGNLEARERQQAIVQAMQRRRSGAACRRRRLHPGVRPRRSHGSAGRRRAASRRSSPATT